MITAMKMNKAVFLDRDGVINKDCGFVASIDKFEFLPRVFSSLKQLTDAGLMLVIITDQTGIGKGYYNLEDMEKVHNHMLKEMKKHDIKIAGIYACTHAPEDKCNCRKPNIEFFKRAEEELNLNLEMCYMIGDKTKDIQAGKNAGTKTVLVLTGIAGKDKEYDAPPDFVAKGLKEASEWIIKDIGTINSRKINKA